MSTPDCGAGLFVDVAEHVLHRVHGDQVRGARGLGRPAARARPALFVASAAAEAYVGARRALTGHRGMARPPAPQIARPFRPLPHACSPAAALCAGVPRAPHHRRERRVRRGLAQVLP